MTSTSKNAIPVTTSASTITIEKKPRIRLGRYPKIKYTQFDYERLVTDPSKRGEERLDFERDRSRIVHSASFRRMQGKTQVFTVGEADFFRTRLTHSLEVAQIGKGLALRLGADPDLVETVCLAHDIGHPPFGHAGETELNGLMDAYGGFEANAQNIRLLTRLEMKSTDYHGLNLTRASVDGQLKYKIPHLPGAPKFYYQDDQDTVLWAGENGYPNQDSQSFECQILDWADEIAYAVHDLEDGIYSGFVDTHTLVDESVNTEVMDRAFTKLVGKIPGLTANQVQEVWLTLVADLQRPDSPLGILPGNDYSERKKYRKMLTSSLIGRYIRAADRLERPGALGAVKSERYLYEVFIPSRSRLEVTLLNCLVWRAVMRSSPIMTLEAKGCRLIRALFDCHMEDNGYDLLPEDWRELTSKHALADDRARLVADYLSGMTDDYTQKLYSRLFLPNHGTVFDKL